MVMLGGWSVPMSVVDWLGPNIVEICFVVSIAPLYFRTPPDCGYRTVAMASWALRVEMIGYILFCRSISPALFMMELSRAKMSLTTKSGTSIARLRTPIYSLTMAYWSRFWAQGIFPRSTIPCQRDFNALRITDEFPGFSPILPELEPRMVSPFIVKKRSDPDGYRVSAPRIASLVKWVHEHAAEPLPSKEAIAEALLRFVHKADRLLTSDPAIHREYDISRLEHELELSTR
jgi:hypothetical protein